MKTLRVGIVGVSGYTGADLLKILHKHPYFEISYVANTQGGVNLDEIHKEFYNVLNLPVQKACAKDVCAQCDVVFFGTATQKRDGVCQGIERSSEKYRI